MNYKEYRKAWGEADKITPDIPLNIDIELSSACNLKCKFCYQANKAWKIKRQFMPYEIARDIIDEAQAIGVPAIKLNWRGEPALHPKFSEIVKYAQGKFHDVIINTNGNFTDAAISGLLCATRVIVSVDSFNMGSYLSQRVGGVYRDVMTNISKLLFFRRGKNPVIELRRVITEDNRRENFKAAARAKFGNAVEVTEHNVFDRANISKCNARRKFCCQPNQRLVIGADGNVFACCVDFNERYKLGSIFREPLLELWHGDKMRALRANLKNGIIPLHCGNCTSYSAYEVKR